MTVTGKIQKFKLRERGIDDLGLQDRDGRYGLIASMSSS